MKEKDLERYFVQFVKKHGGIAYKFETPGIRGAPDRLVFFPGRVLFVELKARRGFLSKAQRLWHRTATQFGFPVLVLRTREEVDWLSGVPVQIAQTASMKLYMEKYK